MRTIGSFCQKCATPDWVQSSKHEHCQGDIVAQRAHAVSHAWIHVQMEFMLRACVVHSAASQKFSHHKDQSVFLPPGITVVVFRQCSRRELSRELYLQAYTQPLLGLDGLADHGRTRRRAVRRGSEERERAAECLGRGGYLADRPQPCCR